LFSNCPFRRRRCRVRVADTNNNTIRKITPAGVVSTFAGTAGYYGLFNGTGPEASFNGPTGLAFDAAGNLYVADSQNNAIRKITPQAVVTTLAGSGLYGSTNGAGSVASFSHPYDIAVDSNGNVYVTDSGDNTIRKITPSGVVSTLAGTPSVWGGYADGVGAAGQFTYPLGITMSSEGNIYVADCMNSTIRKITPTGTVTTVVGAAKQAGFIPGGLPGAIDTPVGLVVVGPNLYMTVGEGVAEVSSFP